MDNSKKKKRPTKYALKLWWALKKEGIYSKMEYWDGFKTVDLYIPNKNLYIEIEGIQHFINSKQILSDLKRDYYSDKEGIYTLRIPNTLIYSNVVDIVQAIKALNT